MNESVECLIESGPRSQIGIAKSNCRNKDKTKIGVVNDPKTGPSLTLPLTLHDRLTDV